jgi:hypothetical protein
MVGLYIKKRTLKNQIVEKSLIGVYKNDPQLILYIVKKIDLVLELQSTTTDSTIGDFATWGGAGYGHHVGVERPPIWHVGLEVEEVEALLEHE